MTDNPKENKTQETQATQGAQEKPQKPIDQAIEQALKKKASDRAKRKAAKFKDRETGKAKDITIDLPAGEDAIYLDELDPESPNFNPDKLEKYRNQLAAQGKDYDEINRRATEALNAAVKSITAAWDTINKQAKFTEFIESFHALVETLWTPEIKELSELLPYLKKIAAKPEYSNGEDVIKTLDKLESQGTDQDGHIIPGSTWERLIIEARTAREQAEAQAAGRKNRKAAKEQAQEINAIMTLKGGKYPIPSATDLWNYFEPGKICEMGTLDAALIDKETGLLRKNKFEEGELVNINRAASPQAFWILSALFYNSVEDVRAEFVKSGELTFYVKGVLDELSSDPRGLLPVEIAQDGQLDISRKTAGVLYLENLFKPLQNYIGVLPNGSRYSVFNYIGYDADSDTMTIKAPYIYQVWKRTQTQYFERIESKKAAQAAGKKPTKEDLIPLEINFLFERGAITEDAATIEAATYITTKMLQAGITKNAPKETKIKFKTLVNNCPTMKQRIEEIENSDRQNKAAFINGELRKIEKAIALILNPEKCSATEEFNIIEIQPTKEIDKTATAWHKRVKLRPPTKGKLNDELRIKWYRNTDTANS